MDSMKYSLSELSDISERNGRQVLVRINDSFSDSRELPRPLEL